MRKFNNSLLYILTLLLVMSFTSCSNSEDISTSEAEIIWKQSVNKGCLNKDPFSFGPGSEYNVYIGSKYGQLFYCKYETIGTEANSYFIDEEGVSNTVDYNAGGLVQDSKMGNLYLSEFDYQKTSLFDVDENTLSRSELLIENIYSNGRAGYELYNDHIYIIEIDETGYHLVRYDMNMSEKSVIHSFQISTNKIVQITSIYEWNNQLYGTFNVSNSKAPYDDISHIVQLDLESGEVLWELEFPSFKVSLHFDNAEMYIFMNGQNATVLDVHSGEKLRIIPAFPNDATFEQVVENVVLIREREFEDNYPIREWLKGIDLKSNNEIFAMEGLFLGVNEDRIYAVDKESIVRIRSISDNSLAERIDLKEVIENKTIYGQWHMADGSNVILGQKDECDTSSLILIKLH